MHSHKAGLLRKAWAQALQCTVQAFTVQDLANSCNRMAVTAGVSDLCIVTTCHECGCNWFHLYIRLYICHKFFFLTGALAGT